MVAEEEIHPGLVVYLYTVELRKLGGSRTNAEGAETEDRADQGSPQFLVLQVDRQAGTFLATPLFSNRALDSVPLDDLRRLAAIPGEPLPPPTTSLIGSTGLFLSMPVPAASGGELSDPGNRSVYTLTKEELSDIAAWKERNRAPFRDL